MMPAVALFLTLAACGGGKSSTEPGLPEGAYASADFTITPAGGNPIDVLRSGGVLQIVINENGSTSGTLTLPANANGGTSISASMSGTVVRTNNMLHFQQDADTFVRSIEWEVFGRKLLAKNYYYNGKYYNITLSRN